jgi:hypothetical protein
VSLCEIEQGARDKERGAITALFSFMTCLPCDCSIANNAGTILKQFRKTHLIGWETLCFGYGAQSRPAALDSEPKALSGSEAAVLSKLTVALARFSQYYP